MLDPNDYLSLFHLALELAILRQVRQTGFNISIYNTCLGNIGIVSVECNFNIFFHSIHEHDLYN